MTSKKPDRKVSKMDVLKDIRGLLSTSQEQDASKKTPLEDKGIALVAAGVEEEVRRYKGLVQKHLDEIDRLKNENKGLVAKQGEIDKLKSENKELVSKQGEIVKLKSENKELVAKLERLTSSKGKSVSSGNDKAYQEIAEIEARKAELSLALSQVEGLVQLKTKELLGRLARVYQEAGQGEIALEFRRGRDEMEVVENLARFVQALLNE